MLQSNHGNKICNAMSVDVEDYFQVSAFEPHIAREDWESMECRVERNIERILALFEIQGIKATFFVLGWMAERYPAMVRQLHDNGHEVASHGYEHVRVVNQTPQAFREDILRTRKILEDTIGAPVIGYRAASYSIGRDNLWALDELQETGHLYSSSIYPIRHDLYGMPEAPRFAFRHRDGAGLLEIPVSTVQVGKHNYPCGGGGYFRLLPYAVSRWAINRVNQHDGQSAVFYFHPWEIDPAQPRQQGIGAKTQVRHYLNLSRMESRLSRLLKDFQWDRMDRVFLTQEDRPNE